MHCDELAAIRETAHRFATQHVAKLVGTEGRDGDLQALPELLRQAEDVGILASADPKSPGYDYGVWGRACLEDGYAASLTVLEELATECAGVAACVHFGGLGALELANYPEATKPASVGLFSQDWRPSWRAFDSPPSGGVRLADDQLNGHLCFVQSVPAVAEFVVYCADAEGWQRVLIRCDADGLETTDLAERTGLAALKVGHLTFSQVVADEPCRLSPATPHAHLRRLMLGLAAIAVGNARGAIRASRLYARQRYQGGDLIGRHAAVQALVGDSHSRVLAAQHALAGAAVVPGDKTPALWHALAIKLRLARSCGQAVTDSLQVFGGYGYMEDYRLEKRLRDAMTLEAMCISPSTLRLLCATDLGGDW